MDCLICYKIFIKNAEFENSPLPRQVCINSICKLLEIQNSPKIGQIFKNPYICQCCYKRFEEANSYLNEMEEFQKKINNIKSGILKDLRNSKIVSDVMWKKMPDRISKSSLDRINLLEKIESSKPVVNERKGVVTPSKQFLATSKLEKAPIASSNGKNFDDQEHLQFPTTEKSSSRIPSLKPIRSIKKKGRKYRPEKQQCNICFKVYYDNSTLLRHKRNQHKSHSVPTVPNPIKCQYCSRTFIKEKQLRVHLGDETSAECGLCKKKFKSIGCLKHHNFVVHKVSYIGQRLKQIS